MCITFRPKVLTETVWAVFLLEPDFESGAGRMGHRLGLGAGLGLGWVGLGGGWAGLGRLFWPGGWQAVCAGPSCVG